MRLRLLNIILFTLTVLVVHAQSSDRTYIRLGNRAYHNGDYQKAETNYQKAVKQKESIEAYFNLANAQVMQGQDSTAFANYSNALNVSTANKTKKSSVYHNIGNIFYASGAKGLLTKSPDASKSFEQAVEAYKSALRLNPEDNETRYNLAKAQHMLKKSQDNKGGGKDNKDNKDDKKDQDKNNQQDKEKQKKEQNPQDKLQPQQPQKDQMDDKTAEQLLNSAQQDEKQVQKRIQQNYRPRSLEKDW